MKLKQNTSGIFENDALTCPDCLGKWSDLGKLTRRINVVYRNRFVMWNAKFGHLTTYPNFFLSLRHRTGEEGNVIAIGFTFSWTCQSGGYGNSERENSFAQVVSDKLDEFVKSQGYEDRYVEGLDACDAFIRQLMHDVPVAQEYFF